MMTETAMGMDELKKVGLSVHSASETIVHDGLLSVEIEFDMAMDNDLSAVRLQWLTKRHTKMHIHDFKFHPERKVMTFFVSAPVHPSYKQAFGGLPYAPESLICNTFVDFCWTLCEGTTSKTQIEVSTPFRKEATPGDLTWVLPSKFADDLIEALHVVNAAVVEGFMQHAVLYGPLYTLPGESFGKTTGTKGES